MNKTIKNVLVIGSDISGCATALTLAKLGQQVSIIPSEHRASSFAANIPLSEAEDFFTYLNGDMWKEESVDTSSAQAVDQLTNKSQSALKEIFDPSFRLHEQSEQSILSELQAELKNHPLIEWLEGYTPVELLTLERHSRRSVDIYKAPTCLGISLYHEKSNKLENFLAKETVLSMGGVGGLFPYTTSSKAEVGEGMALAEHAGARCLNVGSHELTPLALYVRGEPCIPLPPALLREGAQVLSSRKEHLAYHDNLSERFHQELLLSRAEHLWLDISRCTEISLERIPVIQQYCESFGVDWKKDLLPVVPAVCRDRGGVAVDKSGQTSLQRLRAVGRTACTGIRMVKFDRILDVVEGLVWAIACAEDICKQVKKLLYTFPEINEIACNEMAQDTYYTEREMALLREVMWHSATPSASRNQQHRALGVLQDIDFRLSADPKISAKCFSLKNSLYSGMLIVQENKKRSFCD